jgi:hypothetical protein
VITLSFELSSLADTKEAVFDRARVGIRKLGLPEFLEEDLLNEVSRAEDDGEAACVEDNFRDELDLITDANDADTDDGCEDGSCSAATYRERSKRVAEQLRKAASFLPS